MWRKLRKQIAVQREMLSQLLSDHLPVIRSCATRSPDRIELSALAALLHAFYGGVENIFKRVAIELNEGLPRGEGWHKALLDVMTRPTTHRPPVVSAALAETLRQYLDFRHFFRSAYPFQLQWERMAELVRDCQAVMSRLEAELDVFLKATKDRQ